MKTEKLNASLTAFYFEQIVDEACNADMGFNNHFRRTLTIGECVEAQKHAEVWNHVAIY